MKTTVAVTINDNEAMLKEEQNAAKKDQRDPGKGRLKLPEKFEEPADKRPADQRHQRLKAAEGPGYANALPHAHIRFVQAVDQRDRKCVHGKTDAQEHTIQNPIFIRHRSAFRLKKLPYPGNLAQTATFFGTCQVLLQPLQCKYQ